MESWLRGQSVPIPPARAPMFRIWLQVEELDEDGEPAGEPVDPIDVADFEDLGAAEDLIDRIVTMCEGPSAEAASSLRSSLGPGAPVPGAVEK